MLLTATACSKWSLYTQHCSAGVPATRHSDPTWARSQDLAPNHYSLPFNCTFCAKDAVSVQQDLDLPKLRIAAVSACWASANTLPGGGCSRLRQHLLRIEL